jgi:hypothetical protein
MYIRSSNFDSVAQLVEQKTLNLWVLGSSPSGVTSPGSGKFLLESGFFISLKPLSSVYISRTASLTRPVRELFLSKHSFSGNIEPIICRFF